MVREVGGIKVVREVKGLGEGDVAADLVELREGRKALELEDEDFWQFDQGPRKHTVLSLVAIVATIVCH